MGLLNQLSRSLKKMLRKFFGTKKKRGRKSRRADEPIEVPGSWKKPAEKFQSEKPRKAIVVTKHKTRIPGLRLIHRILAAILLLINLIFSQFLLGSVGTGAQPMFIFFLLNAYIIFRYLWGSKKKEGSE